MCRAKGLEDALKSAVIRVGMVCYGVKTVFFFVQGSRLGGLELNEKYE